MLVCCSMGFTCKSIAHVDYFTVLFLRKMQSGSSFFKSCGYFSLWFAYRIGWPVSQMENSYFSFWNNVIQCDRGNDSLHMRSYFFYIKAGVTAWLLKRNVKTTQQLKWTWKRFSEICKSKYFYLFKKLSTL